MARVVPIPKLQEANRSDRTPERAVEQRATYQGVQPSVRGHTYS